MTSPRRGQGGIGRRLRSWTTASWVVLTAPRWLRGPRLESLFEAAEPGATTLSDPNPTCRLALGLLRRLAALPRSPWQYSCLYKSVTVCRCLRSQGIDARVRLGARMEGATGDPTGSEPLAPGLEFAAHAWVQVPPTLPVPVRPQILGSGQEYVPLRPPR